MVHAQSPLITACATRFTPAILNDGGRGTARLTRNDARIMRSLRWSGGRWRVAGLTIM